ncbi:MAG: hypothetical protein V4714_16470 [Bacteroidota bacterium]
MENILVSSTLANTIDYAIRISQRIKARLTFLYQKDAVATSDAPVTSTFEQLEAKKKASPLFQWRSLLNQLYDDTLNTRSNDSETNYFTPESILEKTLTETHQNEHFDLKVVDSKNISMLNYADKSDAHSAVLVVPSNARFHEIGTITLAIDFQDMGAGYSLGTLFQLASAFKAHLSIVNVGEQPCQPREFREAMKQLGHSDQLDMIRHTYHFLTHKYSFNELKGFVAESNSDLLVLMHQQHSAVLELSLPYEEALRAGIPLLILPHKEAKASPDKQFMPFAEQQALAI